MTVGEERTAALQAQLLHLPGFDAARAPAVSRQTLSNSAGSDQNGGPGTSIFVFASSVPVSTWTSLLRIKRVVPDVLGGSGAEGAERSAGKMGPTAVGEVGNKEYKVEAGDGAAVGAEGNADVALALAVDTALFLRFTVVHGS